MGSLKDGLLRAGLVSPDNAERAQADAERDRRTATRSKREQAQEEHAKKHVAAAPGYPNAAPITLARVRELFVPHRARFDKIAKTPNLDSQIDPEIFTLPSAQFVEGDLVVDQLDMLPEGSNLLVAGDVRVGGLLRQRFRAGGLVVFGNLSARHVVTTGSIFCLGDLDVSGVLFGNCTNYATEILGRATVGALVSASEHLFSLLGGGDAESTLDSDGGTPDLDRVGPAETRRLIDESLSLDDADAVADILIRHDALFAND